MKYKPVQLHIAYEEELSFKNFTQLMCIMDDSFDSVVAVASIKSEDLPNDSNFYIKGIKEGSIVFDILVPIIVGVGVDVVSWAITEAIKSRLSKAKGEKEVVVVSSDSEVLIKLPKHVKFLQRQSWTPKEEDVIAEKAVDVYVNKKQKMDVDAFIRDPDFADIIAAHGVKSIRQKMGNIRYILDQERPNGHTLEVSPLKHCSKECIKAVKRYL